MGKKSHLYYLRKALNRLPRCSVRQESLVEGNVHDDLVAVVEDVVKVVDGQGRRPRGHLRCDVTVVVYPHEHREGGRG